MAKAFELLKLERIALQGIQVREREIQDKIMAPLQEDFRDILAAVSQRLGLPDDAIGTTHQLDLRSFSVVELEPDDRRGGDPSGLDDGVSD